MAKRIWRGDSQAVAQVTDITFANISPGDTFTLTINLKDIAVTADDDLSDDQELLEDVVTQFVEAIGDFNSEIPEWAEVSASELVDDDDVVTGLRLTGESTGKPFTVTGASSGDSDSGLTVDVDTIRQGSAAKNEIQRISHNG